MKKRVLSFALALVTCIGLIAPALAAGQPGDTMFSDKDSTYTLSNPILYTLSRSDIQGIDRSSMKMFIEGEPYDEDYFGPTSDYLNEFFWSRMNTVYAVPEGTIVTLPNSVLTRTIFQYDVIWENSVCRASEFGVFNYPGFTSVTLDGGGYILGVELQYANMEMGENTTDIGDNIAGIVFFYVPEKGTTSTTNPFTSATIPSTPTTPTTPSKPKFTDVSANAYYAESVAWAVEKGITAGTSDTTFSPDSTCTTAQILTFLWRSQGQPEPTSKNPFSDVKESDYFYKAALWSSEKGLVSGANFNGNSPCTRSATVTYLWILAGRPDASHSNFTDVPQIEKYAQAVAWAVAQEITAGTSETTFSPETTCTRGQIMTFLYRAYGK